MKQMHRCSRKDTTLSELQLSDDAIDILRDANFDKRLLSEMLCPPDFQRMMLDAEIFVDRIADMRINDMNAVLEAVRQILLAKQKTEDDLYFWTLELTQVQEEEFFGHVVAADLNRILRDIRNAHKVDRTTADQSSVAVETQAQLQEVMSFEGSAKESQVFLCESWD